MATFHSEREKFRAQNQASILTMYEGLDRLRCIGEAATLRAGLGHRVPTAEDLDRWDRELFQTWQVTKSDSAAEPRSGIAFPDDPLRRGNIGTLPIPIEDMRIEATKTKSNPMPVQAENPKDDDLSSLDVDLEY